MHVNSHLNIGLIHIPAHVIVLESEMNRALSLLRALERLFTHGRISDQFLINSTSWVIQNE